MTNEAALKLALTMRPDERYALLQFPALRDANPVRFQAAVTFGSLWRKLSKHRGQFEALEERGIVERRFSRGETLWRPTKPLGLAVVTALRNGDHLS